MAVAISILVPVFNVEKYLRQCLDSIQSQTFKNFEVICINDGSTDTSLAILEDYAQQDTRFRIINKPNSGYGHSMNIGLGQCNGEYIGIVESDDYMLRPIIFWNGFSRNNSGSRL
ncbi:glycosyltransferase family 2 protein [Paralysiella testudinis]|uniref:Glycosyltransferase family 2 protein n=1 Tax=Paralysiella testudinis TaxID=2809020 RepID=A0A892ZFB5_9NEIS|nr:glycosyltransferase family 2 protein [Paralysiella testudinis]